MQGHLEGLHHPPILITPRHNSIHSPGCLQRGIDHRPSSSVRPFILGPEPSRYTLSKFLAIQLFGFSSRPRAKKNRGIDTPIGGVMQGYRRNAGKWEVGVVSHTDRLPWLRTTGLNSRSDWVRQLGGSSGFCPDLEGLGE